MSKPEFVYVIYIASTPEKIFKALTDANMSEQYWDGSRVVSDWKIGGPFALELKREDKDVTGKVLEFDPPRRLAYTFHPSTTGWKPNHHRASPSSWSSRRIRSGSPLFTTASSPAAGRSRASAAAGRSCCRVSRAIWRLARCCTRPGTTPRARSKAPHKSLIHEPEKIDA